MNKNRYFIALLLPLLALGSCADWTTQDPIPVEAPVLRPADKVVREYKADIFSRPIVIGMMHDWCKQPLHWLSETPDSLDVVILKGVTEELTSTQSYDLASAQSAKHTRVLLGMDLSQYDVSGSKELDRQLTKERMILNTKWAAAETEVTPEEREKELSAMTERVTKELHDKWLRSAQQEIVRGLGLLSKAPFDGYSIKLPVDFALFDKAEITDILADLQKRASSQRADYLISVESPYAEAASFVEKATWVLYSCTAVDPTLAHFTEQASLWSGSRFVPTIDLSDKKNAIGYPDSPIFSADRISRDRELIHWTSTNKAGVAFDHIEMDAGNKSGTEGFALLRDLINANSLTK